MTFCQDFNISIRQEYRLLSKLILQKTSCLLNSQYSLHSINLLLMLLFTFQLFNDIIDIKEEVQQWVAMI